MGLDLHAKDYFWGYSSSYGTFGKLRIAIAKSYNQESGEIYEKMYLHHNYKYSEEETKRYNEICNDDLDLLLWHSDCDGKLTYQECRKIASVLKDLEFKTEDDYLEELYEELKDMIDYCAKTRRTLFFS